MNSPCELRRLACPNSGRVVLIEYHGEHHMGCDHVRIRFEPPIAGCDSLQGTNVSVALSADGRYLLVHDATVMLLIDDARGLVGHVTPGRGWYFAEPALAPAGAAPSAAEAGSAGTPVRL